MPRVERYGVPWRVPDQPDQPDRANHPGTGDPWQGRAPYSSQPMAAWRESLVTEFLTPRLGPEVIALEVGPGLGDWTEHVIGSVQTLYVADRRVETLESIRARFGPRSDLREVRVIGDRLATLADGSVDLAYSVDFFPFVDWSVLELWLTDLARVLRPGGRLVIHHAATPRPLRTVSPRRTSLRATHTPLSAMRARTSGARGGVNGSAESFSASGLVISRQTSSWGPSGEFTVDKYRDLITIATKPDVVRVLPPFPLFW